MGPSRYACNKAIKAEEKVRAKKHMEEDRTAVDMFPAISGMSEDRKVDAKKHADLIAAAPDLYEALVVMSEGCEGFCWCCGCTREQDDDPLCFIARQAVANAEGRNE